MLLYLTTIPVIYSILIHTLSMIHHILFVYILLTSNFIFITFFIDYTYMLLFLSLSVNFGQFLYPRHQGIIMSYVFCFFKFICLQRHTQHSLLPTFFHTISHKVFSLTLFPLIPGFSPVFSDRTHPEASFLSLLRC